MRLAQAARPIDLLSIHLDLHVSVNLEEIACRFAKEKLCFHYGGKTSGGCDRWVRRDDGKGVEFLPVFTIFEQVDTMDSELSFSKASL